MSCYYKAVLNPKKSFNGIVPIKYYHWVFLLLLITFRVEKVLYPKAANERKIYQNILRTSDWSGNRQDCSIKAEAGETGPLKRMNWPSWGSSSSSSFTSRPGIFSLKWFLFRNLQNIYIYIFRIYKERCVTQAQTWHNTIWRNGEITNLLAVKHTSVARVELHTGLKRKCLFSFSPKNSKFREMWSILTKFCFSCIFCAISSPKITLFFLFLRK